MARRVLDPAAVAAVYQEALELGIGVRATLMEVFDLDEGAAAWQMRKVRAMGLVTARERVQVHRPTTAVILRGSARERSWEVCQVCLDRWPCRFR